MLNLFGKSPILFLASLSLLLMISACSNTDGDLVFDKTSSEFDNFESSKALEFQRVAAIDNYTPSEIIPYDSLVFLLTDNKTYSVQIISLKSGKVIGERVRQGSGPGEALGIMSSGILNDSIWFHDVTQGKLMKFHLKDFIEKEKPQSKGYKVAEFFYSAELLDDATLIGTGMETSAGKFQYYDFHNQTIRESVEAYDIPNRIPVVVAKDALRSYINTRASGNGANIALVGRYSDVIELINTQNPENNKAIQGPEGFDPIFEIGARGDKMFMSKVKETKKAYVNSISTDEHIFALYSGGLRTEGRKWSEGRTMHVFDWQGNPKTSYDLGHMIYAFGIDGDRQRIFIYNEDKNELLYANY